ncbi:hypothetical protein BIV60_04055 [Bacillus sp. MUM 116]|nr:hypothetical protein BIV60_04055 [Bacillus sp. MUM 116]
MRKYILLICSLFMIFISLFSFYKMNTPMSGPVGNGTVNILSWCPVISILIGGICFLFLSILMFIKALFVNFVAFGP